MYYDYIDRTEKRLGLTGQPRLIVRHIKPDRQGIPREHCHAIWSRIDGERRRAIHMPYDHDTLMMVTREFARDRGLRLPRDTTSRKSSRVSAGRAGRLIDDKKVRIKDVREFLAKDFPKDSLPSVDEALALAAGHRAAMELFRKEEERAAREAVEKQRREDLQRKQQPRRLAVEREAKGLADRQHLARISHPA